MSASGEISPRGPIMAYNYSQENSMSTRKSSSLAMRLGLAFLALIMAVPLNAADTRAVKTRVPPNYPEMAKRMRITGVVKVSVTIAPGGNVTAVKTLSGNSLLSGAAEDAVSKWKFVPAAEESTVEIDINFGGS
jgi:TonB family protein